MATAYRVSRTIRIEASPAEVYPQLVDLRRWVDWSPWEGVDPAMHRTYSGPREGVGAGYAWSGNRQAGAGSMLITATEPDSRVDIDLHFTAPFPAQNQIRLDLDPESQGRACVVSWTMQGRHGRLMRVLSRVMPMDRMVGKDFEQGLAQLKELVEAQAAQGGTGG